MRVRALIITGGECAETVKLPKYGMCIAADSGFITAERLGVFPDVIIGDFDSIGSSMPTEYRDPKTGRCSEIIRHPPMKNETDTMLAANCAVEHGADEVYIVGGLGGRADHTVSNIFLLERLRRSGISACLTDGSNELRVLIGGDSTSVVYGEYRYFSTLALDRCTVSVKGCLYPLSHSVLERANAYAVSNEPLVGNAEVECHEGVLLLARTERLL